MACSAHCHFDQEWHDKPSCQHAIRVYDKTGKVSKWLVSTHTTNPPYHLPSLSWSTHTPVKHELLLCLFNRKKTLLLIQYKLIIIVSESQVKIANFPRVVPPCWDQPRALCWWPLRLDQRNTQGCSADSTACSWSVSSTSDRTGSVYHQEQRKPMTAARWRNAFI